MTRNCALSAKLFCALLSLTALSPLSGAQSSPGKSQAQPPKSPDTEASKSPDKSATVESRVEQYLRKLYAWGPAFSLKVGPPKQSPITDLLEVPVTVSKGSQSDTAVVYVSKGGNYMIRGELTDMTVDPFAETLSKLHVGNSPSMGPENAKVTIYEFADFECPSCRQMDLILRNFMPSHPEVRLVFKNFPLTDIHPWAMTAAIAGQCAYQQSPARFWKLHDAIFDAQEVISPSNVWEKLQDLANQVGLNPESYRTCIINPETANQVKETIEEGHALNITATPTTFVNGHRLVGPDQTTLNQYAEIAP